MNINERIQTHKVNIGEIIPHTSLEERIQNLPDDIIRHIYEEYLEMEVHYVTFQQLLKSRKSIQLDICDIRHYIPVILAKPKLCSYMCKNLLTDQKDPYFEYAYITHKIKNEKMFSLTKKGTSFALTLLMYLYH